MLDVRPIPFALLWLASALSGCHGAAPRCTPESTSTSCRAVSPRAWRTVRLLRHGLRWDARKRARTCFPGIVGRTRHECCSTQRFGVEGNQDCWRGLPRGPWYHLCCGTSRVGPVPDADFALPIHDVPDVERVGLPKDRTCDFPNPTLKDKCAVVFLVYHKTGNRLIERLVPEMAKFLLTPPIANVIWRSGDRHDLSAASSSLSPVTGLPVQYAHFSQHIPENEPEWDPIGKPHPPVFVANGEWIPHVASRQSRSLLPGSDYRGRILHFVRAPADLVVSAFRYHGRERFHEHANFAPFHGLACFGCSIRAWHDIFRRCDYSCSYMALLADTAERSVAAGLAMEYKRSHHMVRLMLENMAAWSADSRVFHVTVDMLTRNFAQTVHCMLRFVMGIHVRSELGQDFVIEQVARTLNHTLGSKGGLHATHSDPQWKQVDLHGMLLRHPVWGEPLRAAKRLLVRIQRRQARLYGCPRV